MKLNIFCIASMMLALNASVTEAAVVVHGPVNSLGTFQDTNTGNVWLRLDNYFGKTYNEMKSDAVANGFTVATLSQVQQLLNSLPLTGGEWPTYEGIMGGAPNRGLIWGAYAPQNPNQVSWAYAYDSDTQWNFEANTATDLDTVPNIGTVFEDMNIWAVLTDVPPVPVPEPSTLALLGMGIVGFAVQRARRQR